MANAWPMHPEPFKETEFKMDRPGCYIFSWGEMEGEGPLSLGPSQYAVNGSKTQCGSAVVNVTFGPPALYRFEIREESSMALVHSGVLKNVYVRRDVLNLTKLEWDDYVDAVWTLKNSSTELGRSRFGKNCLHKSEHYLEYDFFVLFHGFHSMDDRCDQLHFSKMQEYAHEAWVGMFERSLQCVHPSVTLHYWNAVADSHLRENSSVWDASRYGKRVNDERGAAYVDEGAFAYFPIRANRTGLCQYMDDVDQKRCHQFIDDERVGWRGPSNATGFYLTSPRDMNHHEFVSRRVGHLGSNSQLAEQIFPSPETTHSVKSKKRFVDALRVIVSDQVHGYAHYWMSGLWKTETGVDYSAQWNSPDDLRLFVWPQDGRGRADGCVTCNATHCECIDMHGCDGSDIHSPTGRFDAVYSNFSNVSWWHDWLVDSRGAYNYRRGVFQCNMMRGGTFDRSAFANADPAFYLHHAFTFWMVSIARNTTKSPPPLYGLDEDTRDECPGHRLDDETVFSDIVPYSPGQKPGSRHTWRHVLHMWSDANRTCRWE